MNRRSLIKYALGMLAGAVASTVATEHIGAARPRAIPGTVVTMDGMPGAMTNIETGVVTPAGAPLPEWMPPTPEHFAWLEQKHALNAALARMDTTRAATLRQQEEADRAYSRAVVAARTRVMEFGSFPPAGTPLATLPPHTFSLTIPPLSERVIAVLPAYDHSLTFSQYDDNYPVVTIQGPCGGTDSFGLAFVSQSAP